MLLVNWKNDDHYESKILLSMQTLTYSKSTIEILKTVRHMFKVNNKDTNDVPDVVLESLMFNSHVFLVLLLLTLKK